GVGGGARFFIVLQPAENLVLQKSRVPCESAGATRQQVSPALARHQSKPVAGPARIRIESQLLARRRLVVLLLRLVLRFRFVDFFLRRRWGRRLIRRRRRRTDELDLLDDLFDGTGLAVQHMLDEVNDTSAYSADHQKNRRHRQNATPPRRLRVHGYLTIFW